MQGIKNFFGYGGKHEQEPPRPPAKEKGFYVKQIANDTKEVYLTTKYTIKEDNQLFYLIEYIVPMIDQKHKQEQSKYHSHFDISYFHTLEFTLSKAKMEEETCSICLEEYEIRPVEEQASNSSDEDILMLGCSHKYHRKCLLALIGEKKWAKCPICMTIFGNMTGDQPDGKMTVDVQRNLRCQGYEKDPTIVITYRMYSCNRNGRNIPGTTRMAYLPDNAGGREVCELLREAFNRKLIFTVGRSVTTGLDNQIVWNGIHHKTSTSGGASHFGYPDPTYFTRVKEELAFKGIVPRNG